MVNVKKNVLGNNPNGKEFFKKYNAWIVLLLLLLFNIVFTNNFLQMAVAWNIAIQSCTVVLTGMGMTFVISTGGIDISIGSTMALTGITSVVAMTYVGVPMAVILGLLVALLAGAITGTLIARYNIQPIVVTLGMSLSVRGAGQVICNGMGLSFKDTTYAAIASTKLFGVVPIQVLYIFVVTAITWFVINKTIYGLHIQTIGDNLSAARLVGIPVKSRLVIAYMISAFLAGCAGIITIARISSVDGNSLGLLSEMDAIAAVAIGGTNINGGKGRVIGTLIGAFVMELITITVNMNNISDTYAQMLKGIIIVAAVIIQSEKKS